jgi:HD superfamily phosphodiesterase
MNLSYEVIRLIEEYVKLEMSANDCSHDWNHIERVRQVALHLRMKEGLSLDQRF